MAQGAGMQKILVDGGQLIGELDVQVFNNFRVFDHDGLLSITKELE
jgi:hypothetical protein